MLHHCRFQHLASCVSRRWCVALVLFLLLVMGCQKQPTRGSFKVQIVALSNASSVVPGAAVLINGLRVGQTDSFGVFHGSFRGQIGQRVQISVVGQGQQPFSVKARLKARQGPHGWRFQPLQIRALLWHANAPKQPSSLEIRPTPLEIRPTPLALETQGPVASRTTQVDRDRRVRVARVGRRDTSVKVNRRAISTAKATPGAVRKTNCFRRHRGAFRTVVLQVSAKSTLSLIGDCIERLGQVGATGQLAVSLPVGQFVRLMATPPAGKSSTQVVEVKSGGQPLVVRLQTHHTQCDLARVRQKLRNRIVLEGEEIACLKTEAKSSPTYFSSWLFLSRSYCTHAKWRQGTATLDDLQRDPRNRFHPYRSLQMGIEYGRCRQYSKAIPLLKHAAQQVHRMAVSDRYANQKALHIALKEIYERRFHRGKRAGDLNLSLKHAKRLAEMTMSQEPAYCRKVLLEVKRLQSVVSRHGDIEE